ncbi:hypothetical protein NT08PM_1638 [Pasteurella multocida subsp. multocida str. 3480]|nr:hypothetical protein NT08PM_1638 [Pasteurella multocida subsp. multocida str. 3480]
MFFANDFVKKFSKICSKMTALLTRFGKLCQFLNKNGLPTHN